MKRFCVVTYSNQVDVIRRFAIIFPMLQRVLYLMVRVILRVACSVLAHIGEVKRRNECPCRSLLVRTGNTL
jgi:hypothetical protein